MQDELLSVMYFLLVETMIMVKYESLYNELLMKPADPDNSRPAIISDDTTMDQPNE